MATLAKGAYTFISGAQCCKAPMSSNDREHVDMYYADSRSVDLLQDVQHDRAMPYQEHLREQLQSSFEPQLIETCVLPNPYYHVFSKYTYFNAIQSASFEDVFQRVIRLS